MPIPWVLFLHFLLRFSGQSKRRHQHDKVVAGESSFLVFFESPVCLIENFNWISSTNKRKRYSRWPRLVGTRYSALRLREGCRFADSNCVFFTIASPFFFIYSATWPIAPLAAWFNYYSVVTFK